jgi:hypothetical protein
MDATPSADPATAPADTTTAARSRRLECFETGLWIAGFVYQLCYRLVRYDLGFDQLVQFTTTQNAMTGRGLGALTAVLTDLSMSRSVKVTYWPPGWAFMQIPFVAIFRSDFWAVFLSDMTALAILLVAMRSLLNRFGSSLGNAGRLVLVFLLGFLTTPNGDWWYSNAWGLAFFLAAIALVMPRGTNESSDGAYFLSGWLLGGCVWMRYQYLSTIPTVLLAVLLQRDFRPGRTKVAFHIAGIVASLAPLAAWRFLPWQPGALSYGIDARVEPVAAGIHLDSLAHTIPPAAVAVGGRDWTLAMLSRFMSEAALRTNAPAILMILGWTLTLIAVIGAVTVLLDRSVDATTRASLKRFYALGLSGFVLNFLLLGYLSVVRDFHVSKWVYVQIPRYHMIVIPFVLVALAHFMIVVRGKAAMALKLVVATVGLWFLVLEIPQVTLTYRQLAHHEWGPPVHCWFWGRAFIPQVFVSHSDLSRHNVLIHLGELNNNNDAVYVLAMARFSGYAANYTTHPEMIDTLTPVHLALTVSPKNADLKKKFDELCANLGPETELGPLLLCDGTFEPRHRGPH